VDIFLTQTIYLIRQSSSLKGDNGYIIISTSEIQFCVLQLLENIFQIRQKTLSAGGSCFLITTTKLTVDLHQITK